MAKIFVLMVASVFMLMNAAQADKYWQITGVYGQVWALDRDGLVASSDEAYLAWIANGNRVTPIASSSDLYQVIEHNYADHLVASAPGLDALGLAPYQSFLWRRTAGLNITYSGNAALDGRYPVDDLWISGLVVGAILRCGSAAALPTCEAPFPQGQATYNYIDLNGSIHNMNAAQMVTIVVGVEDYVASLYAQLAIGMGGGTPAWPSASVSVGP